MKNLKAIILVLLISMGLISLSSFNTMEKPNNQINEPRFIEVTVTNYIIMHGFDASNKEIEEYVKDQPAKKKMISIDRIQSISEKYICTTYAQNRLIFWEYEGGYDNLKKKLGL
jgi:bisphosphoglycerate-independent phosphoglycerate mutase (AlkP superfamily)